VGLVVLVLGLLVVMPGLLYFAGWGVNRYIQKRLGGVRPPASPRAHRDKQDDKSPARDEA
jgi:hypothetical protein